MIIVSQDKKATTESLELRIDCNVIEEGEFPNIKTNIDSYCIVNRKYSLYLGTYKTEERAEEVLQEIIKSYRHYRTAECDGYTNVLEETAVFEMPEK